MHGAAEQRMSWMFSLHASDSGYTDGQSPSPFNDTQAGDGAGAGAAGRQASASLIRDTWRAEAPEEGL